MTHVTLTNVAVYAWHKVLAILGLETTLEETEVAVDQVSCVTLEQEAVTHSG